MRTGASSDRAGVEADTAVEIGERLERHDLARELVDCACALSRIDPGVSGDPVHGQRELTTSLATRLGASSRQGRLHDENGVVPRRVVFDQRPRSHTADFLVRGPKHGHPRRLHLQLGERAHREQRNRNGRLHVEDARAVKPPVFLGERHTLDLPDVPHGIEMPKDENTGRAASELGNEVVASRHLRDTGDRCAGVFEQRAQRVTASVDRCLVSARRLEPHERLDIGAQLVEA